MKKALIALTATAPLALLASWTANAFPISNLSLSQEFPARACEGGPSPKDRCPYGYRLDRHVGGCEPCWKQRRGSRYGDWNDRYNEPRRYRDYDERYYAPRRYPREYY
jgi:hypothetical protein